MIKIGILGDIGSGKVMWPKHLVIQFLMQMRVSKLYRKNKKIFLIKKKITQIYIFLSNKKK